MNGIKLMKKSLATLLFAFVLGAMLPACSSSEEEEASSDSSSQEASGGDNSKCPEGSDRDYPECMPY